MVQTQQGPGFAHSSEKLVITSSEPKYFGHGQGVMDFGVVKDMVI